MKMTDIKAEKDKHCFGVCSYIMTIFKNKIIFRKVFRQEGWVNCFQTIPFEEGLIQNNFFSTVIPRFSNTILSKELSENHTID